jgi:NNP family nitrate/nitrite transporter-like MFS transporter
MPRFWALLALFALGLAATVGLFSVLPLYLTAELGLGRTQANGLVALSRGAGLVTVLASGWLSDRLGPRRAMSWVLVLTGVATLALAGASRSWVGVAVVLQAVPGSWFFPAAFVALAAVSPLAVSFAVPFAMVLGGGAVPALIGFLGAAGHFRVGVALIGGLLVLGGLLAARLRDAGPGVSA